jgi:hypothetical protein
MKGLLLNWDPVDLEDVSYEVLENSLPLTVTSHSSLEIDFSDKPEGDYEYQIVTIHMQMRSEPSETLLVEHRKPPAPTGLRYQWVKLIETTVSGSVG